MNRTVGEGTQPIGTNARRCDPRAQSRMPSFRKQRAEQPAGPAFLIVALLANRVGGLR